jgi:cytochrome c biogenesis protein CcmG, thiol:disulfide interchange protein DsbE
MRSLFKKYWTMISVLILALGAVWVWLSVVPPGETTSGTIPAPQEGFQAPDFELITIDGEQILLSDLRGQAILLNFWATWCPPCRSEMTAMQQVFMDYEQDGFVVLAVNNLPQDRRESVEAFVLEEKLTFPVLLDNSGTVSTRYQVNSMPTSFFIDPEGIIREVVIGGPMSEALLRTRAENLILKED